MRPTRHFAAHYDVEPPRIDAQAFRPAFRVRTRLDGLLLARLITPAQWQAATNYRRLYERAYSSGFPIASMTPPSGGKPADGMTAVRLDALTWLRTIERHLGAAAVWWLEACVVYDLPWRALAAGHNIGYRTAQKRSIKAIQALARKNSLDTK